LFYTSYASSTGDRGPVQRFHFDVQTEIYSVLGRHPSAEGRLKHAEPAPGPDPAVLTCRSLLVLYSADYLDDAQCGREWSVFRERMDRRLWLTGEPADSLIGVLWRAESLVLPRTVANTGQLLDDFGQGYQGPGVLGLQRDPSAWDRYRLLVRRVAERLMRAAKTPLPAMAEAESRTVEPYFGPARVPAQEQRADRPAPRAAERRTGERRVLLVLVAGTRSRMERLRESVDAYGETAEEWRPFRPYSDEPAAATAAWAAHACGVDRLTVVTLDGGRPGPLSGHVPAGGEPAVVLVLVDPWMTGDASFPALWEQLARSRARVAAVVVVLPRLDEESRLAASRLREALSRTPARVLGASHHEVGSPESLTHTVAAVMADSFTDPMAEDPPWDRAGELPLESSAERLIRRRHERAGWLKRGRGPWPPLFSGTPRESWGGG
jgi:FxsC-like protein